MGWTYTVLGTSCGGIFGSLASGSWFGYLREGGDMDLLLWYPGVVLSAVGLVCCRWWGTMGWLGGCVVMGYHSVGVSRSCSHTHCLSYDTEDWVRDWMYLILWAGWPYLDKRRQVVRMSQGSHPTRYRTSPFSFPSPHPHRIIFHEFLHTATQHGRCSRLQKLHLGLALCRQPSRHSLELLLRLSSGLSSAAQKTSH